MNLHYIVTCLASSLVSNSRLILYLPTYPRRMKHLLESNRNTNAKTKKLHTGSKSCRQTDCMTYKPRQRIFVFSRIRKQKCLQLKAAGCTDDSTADATNCKAWTRSKANRHEPKILLTKAHHAVTLHQKSPSKDTNPCSKWSSVKGTNSQACNTQNNN